MASNKTLTATPVLGAADTTHDFTVPVYVVGQAGGGSAVSISDGSDVTQGALADAGVVTDASGSLSAKLRGLIILVIRAFQIGTPLRIDPTGSTAQPVSSASTLACGGPTASGVSLAASPQTTGGLAKTALPTAVADGQVVNDMRDKYGRTVQIPQAPRDLVGTQTTTIAASTAETTIVTQAASIFADLTLLTIANTSATATRVDIRDTTGGSVIFALYVPAGQTVGFVPQVPIPQTTVNTNWTATCITSLTDLRIFAQWVKNR